VSYEPPTNPSLWQVLLADEEGYVTTAAAALDEYGPESQVEVSIRRLSALPRQMSGGWWLNNRPEDEADIAVEWKLDMVDDIGELDHIEAQLAAARAMAAGLNGAIANVGHNRGTELAAALHDLADKLAVFDGTLPRSVRLDFHFLGGSVPGSHGAPQVDALGEALLRTAGTDVKEGSIWYHRAAAEVGGLAVEVDTMIPAPAEEDPAALRARIVELEAKLAGGAR
jgi:hypothetical protein